MKVPREQLTDLLGGDVNIIPEEELMNNLRKGPQYP